MDKLSRWYGVIIFFLIVAAAVYFGGQQVLQVVNEMSNGKTQLESVQSQLEQKRSAKAQMEAKLKQLKYAATNIQKKIYSPIDADLGNDSLFFTLYSDMIEMVHSNSIKIKAMKYVYNPEDDSFVKAGGGTYFVCDINMELVSNYTNLGKLIQDIYQYPYYIKINSFDVKPYEKDKKILISNLSVRLYARTAPDETAAEGEESLD